MSLFGRTDVASITKNLSSMLAELREYSKVKNNEAGYHEVARTAAEVERDRADRIADKLENILD